MSKLELSVALKQCELDKAAGIDKLNSNITKIGNEVTVEWIKVLADKIWETESIQRLKDANNRSATQKWAKILKQELSWNITAMRI